jgi:Protein of unknown function (DUF3159)
MGNRVVRTAGTPVAQAQLDDLPPPTWRSLASRGVPQFAAEAVLPVAAFYAAWRVLGLAAGIGLSAIVSLGLAAVLIHRGREVGLVVVAAAFVVIQAVTGLLSGSATVYLAQPVVLSGLWGIAYIVSVFVGRPLIGVFACAWYPFPAWFRASAPFKREFGLQSLVWAAYSFARAAFRLVLLLHAGIGAFVLASFVTGTPVIVVLLCWGLWHARRAFARLQTGPGSGLRISPHTDGCAE